MIFYFLKCKSNYKADYIQFS